MWTQAKHESFVAKGALRTLWTLVLIAGLAAASGGAAAQSPDSAAAAVGRGPTVRGTVTTEDGRGLAGVQVRLRPLLHDYAGYLSSWRGQMAPVVHQVESRGDGRYELKAPDVGFWQLELSREGYGTVSFDLVPLTVDTLLADAKLPLARSLEVRLVGAAGQPLEGRLRLAPAAATPQALRLRSDLAWNPVPWLGHTDAEGRAHLSLAATTKWQLEAVAPGYEPLQVPLGDDPTPTLRMQRGASRRAQIVDARGKPVAGAMLRLDGHHLPLAISDEEGGLTAHLSRGESRVIAVAPDGIFQRTALPALPKSKDGEAVEAKPTLIQLPESQRLAGRVLEAQQRQPLAGALVWIPEEEGLDWTRSDDAGEYDLAIPQSSFVIQAAAAGYSTALVIHESVPAVGRPGPTLVLDPAAGFEGIVVGPDGNPIAGVDGRLEPGAAKGVFDFKAMLDMSKNQARSDATGRLAFHGLPVERGFTLTLEGEGWAPVDFEVDPLRAFEHRAGQRWQMAAGRRGVGRIVDGDDMPVVGAEVRLISRDDDQSMRRRFRPQPEQPPAFTTDDEGTFAIPDLAAGLYDLEAKASGFSRGQVRGLEIPVGEGDVDLGVLVMAPGVDLKGNVVDEDGQPIADAQVFSSVAGARSMLLLAAMAAGEPAAESDAEGKFVIADGTPGERVNLVVKRSGYVQGQASNIELPPNEPIEIVLKPASSIEGRVLDADGVPVEGASVMASPEERRDRRFGMGQSATAATTDIEGRFQLSEVAPGLTLVQVTKPGFEVLSVGGFEVPSDRPLHDVELRLTVAAQLLGTLTDVQGEPVVGAIVMAMGPDGKFSPGGFAQTDGDGQFLFSSMPLGAQTITASGEGLNRVSKNVVIKAGENRLDLQLTATVSVSGWVYGPSGQPIQGAQVTLQPQDRRGFMPGQGGADSLVDGSFQIEGVPAGKYRLEAHKEGLGSQRLSEPLEVAANPVAGLELRLGGGGRVVGRILGLEYEAMNRVQVSAYSRGGAEVTQPDFEGKFQVDNVPAGDLILSAELTGSSRSVRQTVTLEEGVPEVVVDLEFVSGFQLTGEVTKGAEPEAGLSLNLTSVDGSYHGSTTTGSDGTFQFEDLKAGTYRLSVGGMGSQLRQQREIEIDGDDHVRIDLEVARLSGRVLDREGQPLSGVQISGEQEGQQQVRADGDSLGRFNMGEVNAGSWTLRFQRSGYGSRTTEVEIGVGDVIDDLEIRLEPVSGLTLEVKLSDGRPASRIHLFFSDGRGQDISGTFQGDDSGHFIVNVLPDGVWQMVLGSQGAATLERRVQVPTEEPVSIVLEEEARLQILIPALQEEDAAEATLQLVGPQGQPYRNVTWQGRLDETPSLQRGSRGLRGLLPGRWRVVASTEDGRVWQGEAVLTAGQTETLRLE